MTMRNKPFWKTLLVLSLSSGLIFAPSGAMAQTDRKKTAPPLSGQAAPSQASPAPAAPVTPAPEFAANIEANKILFAVDISSKVPVGVSDVFNPQVGSVYCWTQLTVAKVPANVRHEWYWNDNKTSESIFRVHYNHTRVWSRRRVRPGQWRVEIRDGDTGRLIAIGAFVVRKS